MATTKVLLLLACRKIDHSWGGLWPCTTAAYGAPFLMVADVAATVSRKGRSCRVRMEPGFYMVSYLWPPIRVHVFIGF